MGSPCRTFGAVVQSCRWVSRGVTGGTFFVSMIWLDLVVFFPEIYHLGMFPRKYH